MQLLGRVFNILRENNPELAGDRRRTVMRPPQVHREGTKKTVFVNFMGLCKTHVRVFFSFDVLSDLLVVDKYCLTFNLPMILLSDSCMLCLIIYEFVVTC